MLRQLRLEGNTIGPAGAAALGAALERNGALQVYFGLACMGLFTVIVGEEMIRDCLEVTYVG